MTETEMEREPMNSGSPVTRIPQDHVLSVLVLLPVESIVCFGMTCKRFKSLANSDSLWESVCRRDWGWAQKPIDDGSWKKLYQRIRELDSVFCRALLPRALSTPIPTPRASHSLNLVSGCLLLFGGGCEGGRHLDDTWAARVGSSEVVELEWQKMNSGVPSGRFGHSCVVIDQQHLVLFGGINDLGARQNDTWVGQLSLQGNTIAISWRLLDVGYFAPQPRGAHAGCSLDNNTMLIHGGIGPSGRRLNDTWILKLSQDLYAGIWTQILSESPKPSSRSGHTLTYIGGTQTILFGGRGVSYEVLNDVWLLDAFSHRWAQLLFDLPTGTPPPLPRVGHSANLILGRRLLIYGGEDSNRHRKNDFWVLDIKMHSTRTWTRLQPKGDVPNCRSFHAACVDNSGRFLYVYGGMVDGLVQPTDYSGLRFDGHTFLVDLLPQP